MSKQKFVSADGVVWNQNPRGWFCSDKQTYQRLGNLMLDHGALTLYDPEADALKTLEAALLGLHWDRDVKVFGPRVYGELTRMGYEIRKKDEE